MKPDESKWELFTPTYDYVKEPYWVKYNNEVILCYPNAQTLHEMSGKGRLFKPCEVEVQLAGWEEDKYHPMNNRK